MAEYALQVRYLGPAVADGRMRVEDLAPALLGLAGLFQEANRVVNPTAPDVSLEIRAVDRGSFVVQLLVTHPDQFARLVEAFTSPEAAAAANLIELVGGVVIVIRLLLRTANVSIVRSVPGPEPGEVSLTLADGQELRVPSRALELYGSIRVRQRLRDVVRPLWRQGIDELEVRDYQNDVIVELGSGDLPALEAQLPPGPDESEDRDAEFELTVAITTLGFGADNRWRLSDGSRTFWARIDDEGFKERVQKNIEAFRAGDKLRCRFRAEQEEAPDGRLRTRYIVVRVLEHQPAPPPPDQTHFGQT